MSSRVLVYATRRSMLALAQCRAFVARLCAANPPLETRELQVVTTGDRIQDRPLSEVPGGGKGLFVKEIEEALLDGRADFAVHSIKDMPAVLPEGLVIACIPTREDPRDVLVAPRYPAALGGEAADVDVGREAADADVGREAAAVVDVGRAALAALPQGARVGTSSLRRAVSLRAHRPDLNIVPLRGNVDTRLRKVDAGECDAIVIARAGLTRLGLDARAAAPLPAAVSLPAPGQGALGIECRKDDAETLAILARLHDPVAARCVMAERGVLEAVGGDCKTPMGAYAERVGGLGLLRGAGGEAANKPGGSMRLRAFVAQPDGTGLRAVDRTIPWPATEAAAHSAGLDLGRSLLSESDFRNK